MKLQDTILEQNRHWRESHLAKECVSRELMNDIRMDSGFIEVITGVRRSGKSTIFRLLIDELVHKKGVNPKEILLVNFDHPTFISYYETAEALDDIVEQAEILSQRKINYIFLDEVQNIHMWEKWVKAKYDLNIFKKIFITGSNADLLESEYITRLSGRYFSHINFPFSFREFLAFKGREYYLNYADNYPLRHKLVGSFDTYLRFGGFPEFIRKEESEILVNYYQTIVLKDVIAMNEIRDIHSLKQTAYYLISNIGSLFSYNRIGENLGIHESTVKEYFDYLKQAYLFEDMKKFDYSVRKQNYNPRKVYCVDNGLISQVGFGFSLNSGRFLENLVFCELKRRFGELYYHKRSYECDFLAGERDKKGPVKIKHVFQVCYALSKENREREFRGLIEAMDEHGLTKGIILTHNQSDVVQKKNKKIVVMPVWRWLCERDANE